MSETPPPPPSDKPDDEEEGQPWTDKDERQGGFMPGMGMVPFEQLPKQLQDHLNHQRLHRELTYAVQKLVDEQIGVVESKLLPEFTAALQNDFRVTNRDAMFAMHAAQEILDKAHKVNKRPSYWSNIHMLRYVAAMLTLEADVQEKCGLLQEEKMPGSTTNLEDIQLPPSG